MACLMWKIVLLGRDVRVGNINVRQPSTQRCMWVTPGTEQVTEEDRAAAKEVQQQVVRAFREILKDNIMIIPTVAGHPLPNR